MSELLGYRCVLLLALVLLLGSNPLAPQPVLARPHLHHLGPVFLTGYDDYGATATPHIQAGPGVCATDWRYIPQGAYVKVPGYPVCRAWDVGGLIIGPSRIDYWFSTETTCYAATGWKYGVVWWR